MLTYQDYIDRLNVQDILSYAGYKLNKRDGLRYPSFVRLDNNGRRVRGDKFLISPGGKCCCKPPVIKSYNIISLITEFPEMFPENAQGYEGHRLVNTVCRKILNAPEADRLPSIAELQKSRKPFNITNYALQRFDPDSQESKATFRRYFEHRGIGLMTQNLFKDTFFLATHTTPKGRNITNLSFPLTIPDDGKNRIVGFEERGRMRLDGTSGYKGKASGSDGTHGLWIASPDATPLSKAKDIYWFESAYDAMAYFQTHIRQNFTLYKSVFLSTGGTPTVNQTRGVLAMSPEANHHLCFDNDLAGRQFTANFHDVTSKMLDEGKLPQAPKTQCEIPSEGYKDWNEELLGNEDDKRRGIIHVTIHTGEDLDGDGKEDIIEADQKVEDKRPHAVRRI